MVAILSQPECVNDTLYGLWRLLHNFPSQEKHHLQFFMYSRHTGPEITVKPLI